jgi:glycosyltransferase involved in cell wall biosynthesis
MMLMQSVENPAPFVVRRSSVAASRLRLSVVVPCFSVGALAVEAVRSILRQTMADVEIIVVDDGSTDDTLMQVLRIDDRRLTCITQGNRGLAGARNTGIRHARAPLIGFCDGDDVWHPSKAAKHLAVMEQDPTIGLTFSYSAYLDESGAPTGQFLVTRCRAPTARDLVVRNHVGNGSTPIVRKECFERAGLFDETLRSCEDVEMWVRLAVLTPYALRLIPEPLTGYRVRQGSLTVSYDSFLAANRLAVQCFARYVPGFTPRIAERSHAEALRIASRKAFSNGQIALSRSLFLQALRHSPALVLLDGRAFVMAALHLTALPLPSRFQTAPYRLLRRLMRIAYAQLFRGDANVPGILWEPSGPRPAV